MAPPLDLHETGLGLEVYVLAQITRTCGDEQDRVDCGELLERGARMADESEGGKIFAQFTSPAGEASGPQIEVPLNLTSKQLNGVINELLGNERTETYSFYINEELRQPVVPHP